MSIVEVTMYRLICDADGCDETAQEGDYVAWASADECVVEAQDSGWYTALNDGPYFCPKHQPVCAEPDCLLPLWDDEFGEFCDEHAREAG